MWRNNYFWWYLIIPSYKLKAYTWSLKNTIMFLEIWIQFDKQWTSRENNDISSSKKLYFFANALWRSLILRFSKFIYCIWQTGFKTQFEKCNCFFYGYSRTYSSNYLNTDRNSKTKIADNRFRRKFFHPIHCFLKETYF